MSGQTTQDLQKYIERLRAGDDTAIWDLLERAKERHRGLAARILGDFPNVSKDPAWQTTDVFHEGRLKLAKSLKRIELNDTTHFFRLAALQIRWFLLDLVRLMPGKQDAQPAQEKTRSPVGQEQLVEHMLEFLPHLPQEQYEIIDLEFIFGFSVDEIACATGTDPKTVRRRRRHAYDAIGNELERLCPELAKKGKGTSGKSNHE